MRPNPSCSLQLKDKLEKEKVSFMDNGLVHLYDLAYDKSVSRFEGDIHGEVSQIHRYGFPYCIYLTINKE